MQVRLTPLVPRMKAVLAVLLVPSVLLAATTPAPKPKPAFQYESGDIKVSIPTADEPRVAQFGAESVRAAAKYLEDGATSWVREKSCVNCHTTGPYLSEIPALSAQLGQPSEEIVADFIEFVPKEVKEVKETATKSGYKHMPGAFSAVWRSLGLAEWDKHVTGKTSDYTERSIRDMFERQAASGAFVSHGEVEIPHITTDFELSLQAVRTITAAPGWLADLKDEKLLGKVEKLKAWLRTAEPKNDWDRVLSLQLAFYLPDLVSAEKRDAALKLLSSKQHADGGWSTRDFSVLNDWHFEVSEAVQKLITGLPDAAKPESDAYMTAFAIVLMRQSGVPAKDERIQKAVTWLKEEQRVSGRWWMHSLYRGNYHYITYIATCQALKALALCDELPVK
jgi:squalene-hopene/tetraprenyl-beta-curcumene cyclase